MQPPPRLQWWIIAVFILASLCALADSVEGQQPRVELAQCMVGEEGWNTPDGWLAIAHVINKRLERARRRFPKLTYRQQLFGYCKALSSDRRWLRNLSPTLAEPAGWPREVRWDRHRDKWKAALRVASSWHGTKDPCPTAIHWGSTVLESDIANARRHAMVEVDCGDTRNAFYRLGATSSRP